MTSSPAQPRPEGPAPSPGGRARAFPIAVGLGFAALQALLFRIEWWPAPRRLWGDELLYASVAQRIAAGLPADLDLLWPASYARALAPFARLGPLAGDGAGVARLAVQGVQVALLVLAALALRGLVRRISGSRHAADAATALFLLDPQIAAYALYLWPEALHLACFLGGLWLLVAFGDRVLAALAAGAALGVALLAKTVLLPFLPLLALAVVVDAGVRRALPRLALVLAVAAAIVAPTVIENGRRYGVYVVGDSSRFNLWVGLNDRSRRNLVDEIVGSEYARWRESGPDFAARDAALAAKIDAFVRERGVVRVLGDQLGRQYFRLFDKDSFLTDQLPGGAIHAQGYGYGAPPPSAVALLRAWSFALHALVLVGACVGLALAASSAARGAFGPRPAFAGAAAAWIGYSLLLFLWLHVKTRYRVQMWPAFDAFAGAGLAWTVARAVRGAEPRWPAPGPLAAAGGALGALLLLFFAFGGPWLGAALPTPKGVGPPADAPVAPVMPPQGGTLGAHPPLAYASAFPPRVVAWSRERREGRAER